MVMFCNEHRDSDDDDDDDGGDRGDDDDEKIVDGVESGGVVGKCRVKRGMPCFCCYFKAEALKPLLRK